MTTAKRLCSERGMAPLSQRVLYFGKRYIFARRAGHFARLLNSGSVLPVVSQRQHPSIRRRYGSAQHGFCRCGGFEWPPSKKLGLPFAVGDFVHPGDVRNREDLLDLRFDMDCEMPRRGAFDHQFGTRSTDLRRLSARGEYSQHCSLGLMVLSNEYRVPLDVNEIWPSGAFPEYVFRSTRSRVPQLFLLAPALFRSWSLNQR